MSALRERFLNLKNESGLFDAVECVAREVAREEIGRQRNGVDVPFDADDVPDDRDRKVAVPGAPPPTEVGLDADEVAGVVRQAVDAATKPLVARIRALEKRTKLASHDDGE